jgi:hypothetical protein
MIFFLFQETLNLIKSHQLRFELLIKVEHQIIFEKAVILLIDIEFGIANDSLDDFVGVLLFFHGFVISNGVVGKNNGTLG